MKPFFVWVIISCILTSRCVLGADAIVKSDASAINSREELVQWLNNTKVHENSWSKNRKQYTRLSWGAEDPDSIPSNDKFIITFEHSKKESNSVYAITIYIYKAFNNKRFNGFEEYLFFLDYVKKKYPKKFEFDHSKSIFVVELSSSDSFANVLYPFYDKSKNWPNTTEIPNILSFYSNHKSMYENLLHELSDFEYVHQVFNWMENNNVKPKECAVMQRVAFGGDVLVEEDQIIHAHSLDTKLKPKKATYPNMNIMLLLKCSG